MIIKRLVNAETTGGKYWPCFLNGFEGRHTHAHTHRSPYRNVKNVYHAELPLDGFGVTLTCDHLDGKTAGAIMQRTSFCAALIRKFGSKHDDHA